MHLIKVVEITGQESIDNVLREDPGHWVGDVMESYNVDDLNGQIFAPHNIEVGDLEMVPKSSITIASTTSKIVAQNVGDEIISKYAVDVIIGTDGNVYVEATADNIDELLC